MEWGWLVPVFIVGFMCLWGMFSTWMRVRHGYPIETEDGKLVHRSDPEDQRRIALLTDESARLQGQILRLEERISVLERIATDPAERTGREIDALRHA